MIFNPKAECPFFSQSADAAAESMKSVSEVGVDSVAEAVGFGHY